MKCRKQHDWKKEHIIIAKDTCSTFIMTHIFNRNAA